MKHLALGLSSTLAIALVLVGCGDGGDGDPSERPVAVLGGTTATVADLERHLAGVLIDDEAGATFDGEEGDRVKSRLFDAFVDEELLLLEAERRDVQVQEHEVDAYLGLVPWEQEPSTTQDEEARRRARRNLMIQKLRGAEVGAKVAVTEHEVDAYVRDHLDSLLPEHLLVIRWITLNGKRDAARVRREILQKQMPFDEAAEVFAASPAEGRSVEIEFEALPEAVQQAVQDLTPGQVSRPVELQGSYYLFLVEAAGGRTPPDRAELRERARNELLRIRSREVIDRLLGRLREETPVVLYPDNLPFRYVEDE